MQIQRAHNNKQWSRFVEIDAYLEIPALMMWRRGAWATESVSETNKLYQWMDKKFTWIQHTETTINGREKTRFRSLLFCLFIWSSRTTQGARNNLGLFHIFFCFILFFIRPMKPFVTYLMTIMTVFAPLPDTRFSTSRLVNESFDVPHSPSENVDITYKILKNGSVKSI